MLNICKSFNTWTDNVQTRVTGMFSEGLKNERAPLVSYNVAIAGLQELGSEVIKTFIIPNIKAISARYDPPSGNLRKSVSTYAKASYRPKKIKGIYPLTTYYSRLFKCLVSKRVFSNFSFNFNVRNQLKN
jgi:hypothetical protein